MNNLVPAAIAGEIEAGRKASNLAFALLILPRDRRQDALTFYRFCRVLDDIADSSVLDSTEKTRAFDAWADAISHPGKLPDDLRAVVARHGIDPALLGEILAGVRSDLTVTRHASFDDVRKYCWRVASAVGLVSIRIFGCRDPKSSNYAETLGLALQWTNILRDVGEDAANGRIYLPLDELHRFGVDEADLLDARPTPNFARLMAFQADRAEEFFSALRVPRADHAALRSAEIMRSIYAKLLRRMRADSFRVFEKRYRISRVEKLIIAGLALLR